MRIWLLLLLLVCPAAANAAESAKLDPNYPYRTDSANDHLPWYQLTSGDFPPQGSAHRVGGELVEADFIHRSGQFRARATGELVNFTLPPFGSVKYLNAEADLRDVPLGTYFLFFLYQDEQGAFTKVATMQDRYTLLAAKGLTYRLDEAKLDQGKLDVTRQSLPRNQADLGHRKLLVSNQTRVWKGDKQVLLGDLAVGDELLVNLTGSTPEHRGRCSDIWVGVDTHKLATEHQRTKHKVFLKERGLPAWIDRVEGKKITLTLFGEPAGLQALFNDEGIVPQQWAAENRYVDVVVANDELRTYNPPVDRQRSMVLDFQSVPLQRYGSSGVCWVIEPDLLLEGFRKGRVVRLFAHPAWPVNDMPFGEGLMNDASGVKVGMEEPCHYSYRTDFANEHLPWYQLKPGVFPPLGSHHLVSGELLTVDAVHRSVQFRADRTGELMNVGLLPYCSINYLNAAADLHDLPLGTRYHFYLYQNDQGAFTKAAVIMDEYSRLVGDKLTYRLDGVSLGEGKVLLASQRALAKNDKDVLVRPPDVGRGEFAVDDKTRVWKGDKRIQLSDMAVGDELLINLTGRTATSRSCCTDIWVGEETHKLVTGQQRAKFDASLKHRGFAGWIDSVEGKELMITFFSGPGDEFQTLFHDGPPARNVNVTIVNEELVPHGAVLDAMKFKNSWLTGINPGTYGCRGTRWIVESEQLPNGYHQGQVVRVFDQTWPVKQIWDDERSPQ